MTITCYTRVHKANSTSRNESPDGHVGYVRSPGGCHGTQSTHHDADGAGVGESAKGERGYGFAPSLKSCNGEMFEFANFDDANVFWELTESNPISLYFPKRSYATNSLTTVFSPMRVPTKSHSSHGTPEKKLK